MWDSVRVNYSVSVRGRKKIYQALETHTILVSGINSLLVVLWALLAGFCLSYPLTFQHYVQQ